VPQLGSLIVIAAVVALLAAIAWSRGGEALLFQGLGRGVSLMLEFALLLVVSFLAAGLATVLVPEAWIREALGRESGLRGILIATGAGMLTPAGPFVAMPLAAVMLRSGAAVPPVLAFLTSWSLLALHRFVAWELPMLGLGVAGLRWLISLALPVLVGLAARALLGR
jgi:uncharacterized membrane protein YraQ (UPF0718 family)